MGDGVGRLLKITKSWPKFEPAIPLFALHWDQHVKEIIQHISVNKDKSADLY